MKRRILPQLCQRILLALASLCIAPLGLYAQQETVPVTIQVLFGDEVPEGLGGTGGGSLGASTISAVGKTSSLVFQELVLPASLTLSDQAAQSEAEREVSTRPATLGAIFRYERIDFDEAGRNFDGNIYSVNAHLAWDVKPFSFGVLIPYDYVALDDVNMHMIGTVLYGRYTLPLNKALSLGVGAHVQYTLTTISDSSDINTFGSGLNLSLLYDQKQFFVGGAVLYHYTVDDSTAVNDHQHLLRMGTRAGVRLGNNAVVTVFGSWIYDATAYQRVGVRSDDNYFDLGTELSFNLSKAWKLSGGYKKVLGLQGFDSNMAFVGTLFRF